MRLDRRRSLVAACVVVGLAVVTVTIGADSTPPPFLDTSIDGIPAGDPDDGHTYSFWYTLTCPSLISNQPCECDLTISGNDCIATTDSNGDGVLDQAADAEGHQPEQRALATAAWPQEAHEFTRLNR